MYRQSFARARERGSTKFLPIYENHSRCTTYLDLQYDGNQMLRKKSLVEKRIMGRAIVCLIRTPYIGACRPRYTRALAGLFPIMHTHITRTGREDPL